jgi:hypothetical protein
VIEKRREHEKKCALEFGNCSNPGDRFGVDGMQGEEDSGPEGEGGSGEGGDQQVNQGDDSGVEENVNEVPGARVLAKEVVLAGIDEHLERAIVVAAEAGILPALMSEGPNIRGESLVKILAFENQRIHEDLEFVVGDEVVAEGGGVKGEREEDEDGEMEEADAGGGGRAVGGRDDRRRWDDGGVLGILRRVFAFPGQGDGILTQGWRERKIGRRKGWAEWRD